MENADGSVRRHRVRRIELVDASNLGATELEEVPEEVRTMIQASAGQKVVRTSWNGRKLHPKYYTGKIVAGAPLDYSISRREKLRAGKEEDLTDAERLELPAYHAAALDVIGKHIDPLHEDKEKVGVILDKAWDPKKRDLWIGFKFNAPESDTDARGHCGGIAQDLVDNGVCTELSATTFEDCVRGRPDPVRVGLTSVAICKAGARSNTQIIDPDKFYTPFTMRTAASADELKKRTGSHSRQMNTQSVPSASSPAPPGMANTGSNAPNGGGGGPQPPAVSVGIAGGGHDNQPAPLPQPPGMPNPVNVIFNSYGKPEYNGPPPGLPIPDSSYRQYTRAGANDQAQPPPPPPPPQHNQQPQYHYAPPGSQQPGYNPFQQQQPQNGPPAGQNWNRRTGEQMDGTIPIGPQAPPGYPGTQAHYQQQQQQQQQGYGYDPYRYAPPVPPPPPTPSQTERFVHMFMDIAHRAGSSGIVDGDRQRQQNLDSAREIASITGGGAAQPPARVIPPPQQQQPQPTAAPAALPTAPAGQGKTSWINTTLKAISEDETLNEEQKLENLERVLSSVRKPSGAKGKSTTAPMETDEQKTPAKNEQQSSEKALDEVVEMAVKTCMRVDPTTDENKARAAFKRSNIETIRAYMKNPDNLTRDSRGRFKPPMQNQREPMDIDEDQDTRMPQRGGGKGSRDNRPTPKQLEDLLSDLNRHVQGSGGGGGGGGGGGTTSFTRNASKDAIKKKTRARPEDTNDDDGDDGKRDRRMTDAGGADEDDDIDRSKGPKTKRLTTQASKKTLPNPYDRSRDEEDAEEKASSPDMSDKTPQELEEEVEQVTRKFVKASLDPIAVLERSRGAADSKDGKSDGLGLGSGSATAAEAFRMVVRASAPDDGPMSYRDESGQGRREPQALFLKCKNHPVVADILNYKDRREAYWNEDAVRKKNETFDCSVALAKGVMAGRHCL